MAAVILLRMFQWVRIREDYVIHDYGKESKILNFTNADIICIEWKFRVNISAKKRNEKEKPGVAW